MSTKNLVFKRRLVKKLTEQYVESYIIEKIMFKNAVKLKLPVSMGIYPVINISRIVRYKELVKKQRVEELKLVKVDRIKE